jgi:hypothetical protein
MKPLEFWQVYIVAKIREVSHFILKTAPIQVPLSETDL